MTTAELLTKSDVAERLQISVRNVENLIARGDIRAVRVGLRSVRISQAELNNFISSLESLPGGEHA